MNLLNYSINNAFVKVQSPSNIAFVKYWGKSSGQIPMNPSLSMTLSHCKSITEIHFSKSSSFTISSFLFDNLENDSFREKTLLKLESLLEKIPWLNHYSLRIKSENTFPHSSGIASSASGFSAIIYALLQFEKQLMKTEFSYSHASHLARLCSGSASRSFYDGYSHWGESHIENSSNLHAESLDYNLDFEDTIAIVSSKIKNISSSAGHGMMDHHPFAQARYKMAKENFKKIDIALSVKDISTFGQILESEALTLHGLMMSSSPSYILLDERSISIIKAVQKFRENTGEQIYFTIDAGPNIHLIYVKNQKIIDFINKTIYPLCDHLIFDRKGNGPSVLEAHYE